MPEFDLGAFLAGRVRRGKISIPGAGDIEVKELGAIERLKILAEFEEAHRAIMEMEPELVLIYERIAAGKAEPEDSFKVARFNEIAAPYYSALISAITVNPNLSPEDVQALFNALKSDELKEFIDQASAYFAPPDIEDLKKNHIGGT